MNRLLALVTACCATLVAHAEPFTVTVEGNGYLRFICDGKMQFGKGATLTVIEGRLCAKNGAKLVPAVSARDINAITIDLDGTIKESKKPIGRIVLALFEKELTGFNEEGLTSAIDRPTLGNPGEGENGVTRASSGTKVGTVTVHQPDSPKVTASLATDINAKGTTSTTTTPSGIQITVSDRVEVEGDTITLGDIATVTAPKSVLEKIRTIDLGTTPVVPIERIVERARIVARLRATGIDPELVTLVGPEKIKVTRKGQIITHERFVDAAIRGAQVKGYGSSLECSTPGPDLKVPAGELELVCESIAGANTDLSAIVGIYVDGKRYNSRTVKLQSTIPAVSLKIGTVVTVRVMSGAIFVESKGKVTKVDPATGIVSVTITETGAVLTGTLAKDGAIEVKA